MRKITPKTRARIQECRRVFMLKLSKEGYMCQHCKKFGNPYVAWNPLNPHHKDHNRNNNAYENIEPMHDICQNEHHQIPRDNWVLWREK